QSASDSRSRRRPGRGHAVTSEPRERSEKCRMARSEPQVGTGTAAPEPVPSAALEEMSLRPVRRRDDARHRLFSVLTTLSLFLVDGIALITAFTAAYRLRDITGTLGPVSTPPRDTYLLLVSMAAATTLAVFVF